MDLKDKLRCEGMKLYKSLDKNGNSCNGGKYKWSLPKQNADGTWTPGEWAEPIEGKLKSCENGYHVCNADQLLFWLNAHIFEVEVGEEIIHEERKSVCRECRLVRELKWNERTARLFACDCAERVLHIFENKYPKDNRPHKAIETVRRHAAAAAAAYAAYTAAAADAARSAEREWQIKRLKKLLEE
jgi:hypothetical protein